MATFDDLVFHPDFEGHQAAAGRHVVTIVEADQAWIGQRTFVRNRRRRAGQYLMIGRTDGGRSVGDREPRNVGRVYRLGYEARRRLDTG